MTQPVEASKLSQKKYWDNGAQAFLIKQHKSQVFSKAKIQQVLTTDGQNQIDQNNIQTRTIVIGVADGVITDQDRTKITAMDQIKNLQIKNETEGKLREDNIENVRYGQVSTLLPKTRDLSQNQAIQAVKTENMLQINQKINPQFVGGTLKLVPQKQFLINQPTTIIQFSSQNNITINANSNEVLKQNNQVPLSLMSAIQLPHQSQLNKTYLNQTEVSQPQGNPNYNIFRKQNQIPLNLPQNQQKQPRILEKNTMSITIKNQQTTGNPQISPNNGMHQISQPNLPIYQISKPHLQQSLPPDNVQRSVSSQQFEYLKLKSSKAMMQVALQRLQGEQDRLIKDIIAQNKHINPTDLLFIIQSYLFANKNSKNGFLQKQGFANQKKISGQFKRGAGFQQNQIHSQNISEGLQFSVQSGQIASQQTVSNEMLNTYQQKVENLQALQNLSDFLLSQRQKQNNIQDHAHTFSTPFEFNANGMAQGGFINPYSQYLGQGLESVPPSNMSKDYNAPQSNQKRRGESYGVKNLDKNALTTNKIPKIPFQNAYVEDCYKYIIMPGNNSQIVRRVMMEKRSSYWIEIPPVHSFFNFMWKPFSAGIHFERLTAIRPKPGDNAYGLASQLTSFNQLLNPVVQNSLGQQEQKENQDVKLRQAVNHLEFHQLLSEKYNLLQVMQKYCDLQKENVFDFLPLTFYIEMPNAQKESVYNTAVAPFAQLYQVLEENRQMIPKIKEELKQQKLKEQEQINNLENQNSDQKINENNEDHDERLQQEDAIQESEKTHSPLKFKDSLKKKKDDGILNQLIGSQTVYKTPTKDINKNIKFKQFNFEKRQFTKHSCPLSHFDGHNLWLLKPTHLNRGRGIHVFRDLATLHKLIKEYCSGKDEEILKKKGAHKDKQESVLEVILDGDETQEEFGQKPKNSESPQKNKNNQALKIKHNTFIIQKYIERPLLIRQRKFDIRAWVLLDQDHNLYLFKEGYIRTSGSEYTIDEGFIDNAAVHLTNNAVQKQLDTYGQFEDGNQLSYNRFQTILDEEQPNCKIDVRRDILPTMKYLIMKSFYAVRKTVDPYLRQFTFELFGYDFIIDEDFNVWLIEVNTNPCIEESSAMLKAYMPRMLDDMFKITLDNIFPKGGFKKKPANQQNNTSSKINSVHGQFLPQSPSPAKHGAQRKQSLVSATNYSTRKKGTRQLNQFAEAAQSSQNVRATSSSLNEVEINSVRPIDSTKLEEQKTLENNIQEVKSNEKKRGKPQGPYYPVDGYTDTENMWEKLVNLEKVNTCPTLSLKQVNNRHKYVVTVADKILKVKKNANYK